MWELSVDSSDGSQGGISQEEAVRRWHSGYILILAVSLLCAVSHTEPSWK